MKYYTYIILSVFFISCAQYLISDREKTKTLFPESDRQLIYSYKDYGTGLFLVNVDKYIKLLKEKKQLEEKYGWLAFKKTKEGEKVIKDLVKTKRGLKLSTNRFSVSNNGKYIVGLIGDHYKGFDFFFQDIYDDTLFKITSENYEKYNNNTLDTTYRSIDISETLWSSNNSDIIYCEYRYPNSYLRSINLDNYIKNIEDGGNPNSPSVLSINTILKSKEYEVRNAIWLNNSENIAFAKYSSQEAEKSKWIITGLYIIDKYGRNEMKLADGFIYDIQVDNSNNIYFLIKDNVSHDMKIMKYVSNQDTLIDIVKTKDIQSFHVSSNDLKLAYIKAIRIKGTNDKYLDLYYGKSDGNNFNHYNPEFVEYVVKCSWSPNSKYLSFIVNAPIYDRYTNVKIKDQYYIKLLDSYSNEIIDIVKKNDNVIDNLLWR